jgi:hypothetical protein
MWVNDSSNRVSILFSILLMVCLVFYFVRHFGKPLTTLMTFCNLATMCEQHQTLSFFHSHTDTVELLSIRDGDCVCLGHRCRKESWGGGGGVYLSMLSTCMTMEAMVANKYDYEWCWQAVLGEKSAQVLFHLTQIHLGLAWDRTLTSLMMCGRVTIRAVRSESDEAEAVAAETVFWLNIAGTFILPTFQTSWEMHVVFFPRDVRAPLILKLCIWYEWSAALPGRLPQRRIIFGTLSVAV